MNAPVTLRARTAAAAEDLAAFRNVGLRLGGRTILHGIDLTLARGEFLCVAGGAGCGKATLLRMLAGLRQPSFGTVVLDGEPVRGPSRRAAVVFRDAKEALVPWRTASGNVSLALQAMGVGAAERRARIPGLLARVGLDRHAHVFPWRMSPVMRQRLQIARCLAQEPDVLLLDEPFSMLDADTRQAMQDALLDLVGATGLTVFFVTEDPAEAIYLGDRVIGLRPRAAGIGAVLDVGLPRPRNPAGTRAHPEFLRLCRLLSDVIGDGEVDRTG